MDNPTPLNLCPLCPVGQMSATPDLVLDPSLNITCGSLETVILPFLDQTQCDEQADTIAQAVPVCSCEASVPTCPDGTPLKQPDLPIDLTSWGVLDAETMLCRDLDEALFGEDNEEEYNNYLIYCGCVGSVETSDNVELECPGVCDNGDPLDPAFYDTVVNEEWGTCGELALYAAWIAIDGTFDDDCAGFTYYGNKVCGCTPRKTEYCEICEDGSVMNPEPDNEFVCLYEAGYSYAIDSDDEECPYYQGLGVYCGCSNPIAEEGVCRLCGDDKLIPNFFTAVETSFYGSEGAGYPCTEYETTDEIYEVYYGEFLSCEDRRLLVGGECCPTLAPSGVPSDVPSVAPTDVPSMAPTDAPSMAPTDTSAPSMAPTDTPSDVPSVAPTDVPSVAPTDLPSMGPTESVAPSISGAPSDVASMAPTDAPSMGPTDTVAPSMAPTSAPSDIVSMAPTDVPSMAPTDTVAPSMAPTDVPSMAPTDVPSMAPTDTVAPSVAPTDVPSVAPTDATSTGPTDTVAPSMAPTGAPSDVASMAPTDVPTTEPTSSAFQVCLPKKSLLITLSVAVGTFMFGI